LRVAERKKVVSGGASWRSEGRAARRERKRHLIKKKRKKERKRKKKIGNEKQVKEIEVN